MNKGIYTRAWCLVYKGEIWPAYCHRVKKILRQEAVNNCPEYRTWEQMYAAGYRIRQVMIKVIA